MSADQIKICDEPEGLHIPLWFFNYEEIHSLFVESSEGTSTNQRAAVINYREGSWRFDREGIEKTEGRDWYDLPAFQSADAEVSDR